LQDAERNAPKLVVDALAPRRRGQAVDYLQCHNTDTMFIIASKTCRRASAISLL
jgi:hypothetical protein